MNLHDLRELLAHAAECRRQGDLTAAENAEILALLTLRPSVLPAQTGVAVRA